MGECHCSNIAIMQLFHELKQQFPALPDHVVSQCIAQNSHDRETCARSLRATQDSRPSPGAFPPPAPGATIQQQHHHHHQQKHQQQQQQQRCCAMNQSQFSSGNSRQNRPASLDIGTARRSPIGRSRVSTSPPLVNGTATPSSAPASCTTRGFFDDTFSLPPVNNGNNNNNNKVVGNSPGFELNVNVACSPAGNRDFRTVQSTSVGGNRSDLIIEPRSHYVNALGKTTTTSGQIDNTRSYTSVSLTLRPPSSEPQAPIDIRSQGSSLTYSSSSLDPRGFQSRLQISIGPGNVGSVAAARIRPPMVPQRPNTLVTPVQVGPHRPPGLPAGPPSQLPRPTTTMSAPSTPCNPSTSVIVPTSSLPTTPSAPPTALSPTSSPNAETNFLSSNQNRSPLNQVAEHQRKLVAEQLERKERLARELRAEKGRLEAMKKERESLARLFDSALPPQELKKKLKSEIYQLQVECERLAVEVDHWSDPRVPLGETNEEFYQDIYTGQPFLLRAQNQQVPPPLPSEPPAWLPQPSTNEVDRGEREDGGRSWVCRVCTFHNHPLMNDCEQCEMPKFPDHENTVPSYHGIETMKKR